MQERNTIDFGNLDKNQVYYVIPTDTTSAVFARVSFKKVLIEPGVKENIEISSYHENIEPQEGQELVETFYSQIIPIRELSNIMMQDKTNYSVIPLLEGVDVEFTSEATKENGAESENIKHILRFKDGMILEKAFPNEQLENNYFSTNLSAESYSVYVQEYKNLINELTRMIVEETNRKSAEARKKREEREQENKKREEENKNIEEERKNQQEREEQERLNEQIKRLRKLLEEFEEMEKEKKNKKEKKKDNEIEMCQ